VSFQQFANLANQQHLRHGVSVRERPDGRECNFSSQHPQLAYENKLVFSRALDLESNTLVRHKQVHSNHIAVVTKPAETVGEADGLCTNRFDIALMLLGADCPLIMVYDSAAPAVGLAHAGWRGTVQHVTMNLVETMVSGFGCCAENMLAGIGPGICKNCYLVGEEVMMIAVMNLRKPEGLFRRASAENAIDQDRWYFDLIEANRRQLLESDIPAENIEISGYCTSERIDLFPSYRREGAEAGRWALMAGLVNIK